MSQRLVQVWIGAVSVAAFTIGCARAVVPPITSIPTPAAVPERSLGDSLVPTPWTPQPVPQPTPELPFSTSNPWKPTSTERKWKYIVVHHTASETGSVESIHEEHQKKKDKKGNSWLGIGYHFVIGNGQGMSDGEIEPTFRWKTQIQGAHAGSADRDYNELGIGICLVGNFEKTPPSANQMAAVKRLVRTLKTAYGIGPAQIVRHSDVRDGGTDCPGKLFPMDEVAAVDVDVNLVDALADAPLATTAGLPGRNSQ